jgi:hypothetical protein
MLFIFRSVKKWKNNYYFFMFFRHYENTYSVKKINSLYQFNVDFLLIKMFKVNKYYSDNTVRSIKK